MNFFFDNIEFFGFVIALLAFIRPELGKIYNYFFCSLTFHKSSGLLEVGYYEYGPTIGVSGTFSCKNKGLFIKNIKLSVTRKSDMATYNFSWGVFRYLNIANNENNKIELAYPFNIGPNTSRNLDIQFHDVITKDKMAGPLQTLVTNYSEFLREKNIIFNSLDIKEKERVKKLYLSEPNHNHINLDAYNSVLDEFYWREGDYESKIIVETDVKNFIYPIKFFISAEQSKLLKLNCIGLCEFALGNPNQPFFANIPWEIK